MPKLRIHFRLVLIIYWFISLHTSCCLARILRCSLIWIRHSLQASIASTHRHVHVQIVVLGSFLHYFWFFFFCSSIRLTQLILWQRRFFGPRYIGDDIFFRADRFLGAKQEGLTIVHFLNKLIVSCKEAVRFPIYFFFVIFKLDSYFLFKLKGYFLYFTPIVNSMLKLRIHYRLVLIVYRKCIDSSPYTHVAV
jgi:hypothetical protein